MDLFILSLSTNLLLLIIITAIMLAYHKQENNYRKQLLDKLDRLIQLLQTKDTNN